MADADSVSTVHEGSPVVNAASQGQTIKGTPPPQQSGEPDSKTTVGNMAELKEVAPKVYNAMMLGIATNICWEQKRHADHLKKMIREGSNR